MSLYVCLIKNQNENYNLAVEVVKRVIDDVDTHLANDKESSVIHFNQNMEEVYTSLIENSYSIGMKFFLNH